ELAGIDAGDALGQELRPLRAREREALLRAVDRIDLALAPGQPERPALRLHPAAIAAGLPRADHGTPRPRTPSSLHSAQRNSAALGSGTPRSARALRSGRDDAH